MLLLRLEIYFSHKTSQIYRKCHMHITFDCKQMSCSSLYLLTLQIWIIMMQIYYTAKYLEIYCFWSYGKYE